MFEGASKLYIRKTVIKDEEEVKNIDQSILVNLQDGYKKIDCVDACLTLPKNSAPIG